MGRAKKVTYINGRYQGSLSAETCGVLEALRKIECVPDLLHIIKDMDTENIDEMVKSVENFGVYPMGLNAGVGTLRPEQTVGVAYMYWAKCLLLGDSTGLGKTVQVAGLINLLRLEAKKQNKTFRVLYLTEVNLVEEARQKLMKFTGEYFYEMYGEAKNFKKFLKTYGGEAPYDIIGTHSLVKQPLFRQWWSNLDEFPFDLLVVDESKVFSNMSTDYYKCAEELRENFDRVIFMDATPFDKELMTFYGQLNLIDKTLMPAKTDVEHEYCVMALFGNRYPKKTGKYKNQEQFKNLVGYRYFSRTRKLLGVKMENCTGVLLESPLSEVQKDMMRKTQLWRIVCDCPQYLDDSVPFCEDTVPKLSSLLELLENDSIEGKPVLLYAHYKESHTCLKEWLENYGYSANIINGNVPRKERNIIKNSFRNGDFQILITNVTRGLDLEFCDHCVCYSVDTSPSKYLQIEGRLSRSLEVKNKHFYILASKGKEMNRINKLIRPRVNDTRKFTDTDISTLLTILAGGE